MGVFGLNNRFSSLLFAISIGMDTGGRYTRTEALDEQNEHGTTNRLEGGSSGTHDITWEARESGCMI